MTSAIAHAGQSLPSGSHTTARAVALVRAAMEAVVLVLVCAAPWFYGAVHPGFELLLFAGVSLVLVLWGARMLLEGHLAWKKCPVALCLAGLFLLGIWQITPLSKLVLSQLSPGTSELYDRLLPERPEALPGEGPPLSVAPAGRTISLYPAATRMELARLLAVFWLFAAVRNNIASEAGLRRLAVVATVNGAALSLFALVQFFSSRHNVLYWTYPSLGQVYGPFICRNHFPFYVNVCLGLGLSLLLGRFSRSRGRTGGWRGLLHDPAALWVCAALALMLGAVVFSLSRGGFLALAGAGLVCLLLGRSQATRSPRWGTALLVVALAVLLTSWLGFALVADRLATLWKGQATLSRLPLWARTAALVQQFPLWGTGYGTFSYAERLHQYSAQEAEIAPEHAHNEYLEVLIEGGAPGLVLGLLITGFVFWLGCRAVRLGKHSARRGLALGALFGFTTLVIHSFGDFGLHIPAITLLATVLSAHLCALGDAGRGLPADAAPAAAGEYRLRLGRLAPLLGAGTCVALGLALCSAGWRAHRVDRLREAAFRVGRTPGPDGAAGRVACLEEAAQIDPEDAELQAELGRARLRLFEEKTGRLEQKRELAAVGTTFLTARGDWPSGLGWIAGWMSQRELAPPDQHRLVREDLLPALRHFLNARDRCPLLVEPHLMLATHVTRLEQADTRAAYLERVKLLSGGDPESWYLCGVQELFAKQPGQAWASWRRCLELSDRYLPQILEVTSRHLSPAEMVETVLPDRPVLLVAAASQLYPEAGAVAERRPFMEKILRLLDQKSPPFTLDELHAKALAHKSLGQPKEAEAAYQQVLARDPGQAAWRYELAEILREQGRLEEARRALVVVLTQQPGHAQARELLALVNQELARQK